MTKSGRKSKQSQHEAFKDLALKLGTDESEERFFEALRKVAKSDPQAAKIVGKLPEKKKDD